MPKWKRRKSERDNGLPDGVYRKELKSMPDKFRGIIVEAGKPNRYTKSCTTPEEAAYRLSLKKYGNHWNLEDTCDFFGFIYLVTERKTGKQYIGKKQMYYWDGPTAGYKCSDPSDEEWWDPKAWRDGEWRTYMTSSDEIKELIAKGNPWDFTWEVLRTCKNVLELHKAEVAYQEAYDVLEALDEDGSYHYYNKNIAGLSFRPPFRRADVKEAIRKTAEDARNYYLKPDLDEAGRVIPFGASDPRRHTVDNDRPTKEVQYFEDIR